MGLRTIKVKIRRPTPNLFDDTWKRAGTPKGLLGGNRAGLPTKSLRIAGGEQVLSFDYLHVLAGVPERVLARSLPLM